jgi:hypothetical protein
MPGRIGRENSSPTLPPFELSRRPLLVPVRSTRKFFGQHPSWTAKREKQFTWWRFGCLQAHQGEAGKQISPARKRFFFRLLRLPPAAALGYELRGCLTIKLASGPLWATDHLGRRLGFVWPYALQQICNFHVNSLSSNLRANISRLEEKIFFWSKFPLISLIIWCSMAPVTSCRQLGIPRCQSGLSCSIGKLETNMYRLIQN